MKEHMLPALRTEVGLGSPPEPYYQNKSESMNEVIKDQVKYQESELPEFIQRVSGIGERHKDRLRKAVARTGEWELLLGFRVPGETELVQNDLTTEGSSHEGCNEDRIIRGQVSLNAHLASSKLHPATVIRWLRSNTKHIFLYLAKKVEGSQGACGIPRVHSASCWIKLPICETGVQLQAAKQVPRSNKKTN